MYRLYNVHRMIQFKKKHRLIDTITQPYAVLRDIMRAFEKKPRLFKYQF